MRSSFFLLQDDQKQLYYISESVQDRTRVQINTGELSFPQVSYHDSTTEINFVEIQAVDTDSTFYHSHSCSSRLLLLFCAQKGGMYTNYRNFILISIAIKCYFKRVI